MKKYLLISLLGVACVTGVAYGKVDDGLVVGVVGKAPVGAESVADVDRATDIRTEIGVGASNNGWDSTLLEKPAYNHNEQDARDMAPVGGGLIRHFGIKFDLVDTIFSVGEKLGDRQKERFREKERERDSERQYREWLKECRGSHCRQIKPEDEQ